MKVPEMLLDDFGAFLTLMSFLIFIVICFILDKIHTSEAANLQAENEEKVLKMIAEKISYKILERLM